MRVLPLTQAPICQQTPQALLQHNSNTEAVAGSRSSSQNLCRNEANVYLPLPLRFCGTTIHEYFPSLELLSANKRHKRCYNTIATTKLLQGAKALLRIFAATKPTSAFRCHCAFATLKRTSTSPET